MYCPSILRKFMGYHSDYYVADVNSVTDMCSILSLQRLIPVIVLSGIFKNVFTLFLSRYTVNDHVTHQPNKDVTLSLSLSLATEQGTWLCQFWFSPRKKNCNTFFMGSLFENY